MKRFVIIIGLVVALSIVSAFIYVHHTETTYNNGICVECGGNYEYNSVVGHARYTTYIYKCDNCNKVIELEYIPN